MKEIDHQEHFFTTTYHITKHAIDRYCQRVLGLDIDSNILSHKEKMKVINEILDSLPSNFNKLPFKSTICIGNNYYAVIKDGKVVTIIRKEYGRNTE